MNCLQLKELNSQGFEIILVSSGAVGVGRQRLRYRKLVNSRCFKSPFSLINQTLGITYFMSIFSLHIICSSVLSLNLLTNGRSYFG